MNTSFKISFLSNETITEYRYLFTYYTQSAKTLEMSKTIDNSYLNKRHRRQQQKRKCVFHLWSGKKNSRKK